MKFLVAWTFRLRLRKHANVGVNDEAYNGEKEGLTEDLYVGSGRGQVLLDGLIESGLTHQQDCHTDPHPHQPRHPNTPLKIHREVSNSHTRFSSLTSIHPYLSACECHEVHSNLAFLIKSEKKKYCCLCESDRTSLHYKKWLGICK